MKFERSPMRYRRRRNVFIKRICLVLLFLLAAALPAAAGDKVEKETLVSGGQKHSYYLPVPKSGPPSSPAPLLVLLHGSNHNGLSLIDKWKDLAAAEGIILAGPDSLD